MEFLLRKYLWAIDCVAIALVALFCARATAVAIESALIRRRPSFVARPNTPPPAEPVTYAKDVHDILARNIFCSTCKSLLAPPSNPGEPAPPAGPQKTSLPLKLIAIMYDPRPKESRWSVAVIGDTEGAFAGPYGVGDKVRGATVVEIQQTRVLLDDAGRQEFVDLIQPSSPAPGSEPAVVGAPTPVSEAPPPPPAVAPPVGKPLMTSGQPLFSVRGDRRAKRHQRVPDPTPP